MEKLLKLLDANNISVVLIPPHCTDLITAFGCKRK